MTIGPDTRAITRGLEALTHECRRIADTLTQAADDGPLHRDPFGPETLAAALFPTADEEQLRADRRARLDNLLARLDRHGSLEPEERKTLRMLTAVETAEADEARTQLVEKDRDRPWSTALTEDLEQARAETRALRQKLEERALTTAAENARMQELIASEKRRADRAIERETALEGEVEAQQAAIDRARGLASRWAVLRAYGSAATELRAALDGPAATEATRGNNPRHLK